MKFWCMIGIHVTGWHIVWNQDWCSCGLAHHAGWDQGSTSVVSVWVGLGRSGHAQLLLARITPDPNPDPNPSS